MEFIDGVSPASPNESRKELLYSSNLVDNTFLSILLDEEDESEYQDLMEFGVGGPA
jgi:hypothetical protein